MPHPGARDYVETVCAGVHRHLLRKDRSEVPLAGRRGPALGGDLRFACAPAARQRRRSARPAGSCTKVLRRATDLVTFDLESFERARAAVPEDARIVLAPSHRSYLDFVLCSYLCFARPDLGIGIPHIAAAVEFARIPLLGRIFREPPRLLPRARRRPRGQGAHEPGAGARPRADTCSSSSSKAGGAGRAASSSRSAASCAASRRPASASPSCRSRSATTACRRRRRSSASSRASRSRACGSARSLGWTLRMAARPGRARPDPHRLRPPGRARPRERRARGRRERRRGAPGRDGREQLPPARVPRATRSRRASRRARSPRRSARAADASSTARSTARPSVDPRIEATLRQQFAHHFYPEARRALGDHPVVAHQLARHDRRTQPAEPYGDARRRGRGERALRADLPRLRGGRARASRTATAPLRRTRCSATCPECQLDHAEAAFEELAGRSAIVAARRPLRARPARGRARPHPDALRVAGGSGAMTPPPRSS